LHEINNRIAFKRQERYRKEMERQERERRERERLEKESRLPVYQE